MLYHFGITDYGSIQMFMATCSVESGSKRKTLETGSDSYFAKKKYTKEKRGAGYIQLTGTNHSDFLSYITSDFTGEDTATFISDNHAWDAAGWYWGTRKLSEKQERSPNRYILDYGATDSIYLILQYYVKGEATGEISSQLTKIRQGSKWEVRSNRLYVDGGKKGGYAAPGTWIATQSDMGRYTEYQKAKSSFK